MSARGETELRRFAQTLEEILRTIAEKGGGGDRLARLRADNQEAFDRLRALFGADADLAPEERAAVAPMVEDVSRLLAFAIQVAEADSSRVEEQLEKVHGAVRSLDARRSVGGSGASCNVTG